MTHTTKHPEWLPAIGSTVHLMSVKKGESQSSRKKRKPMTYTILEYKELDPGEWVFKAIDRYGLRLTDGIDTLRR